MGVNWTIYCTKLPESDNTCSHHHGPCLYTLITPADHLNLIITMVKPHNGVCKLACGLQPILNLVPTEKKPNAQPPDFTLHSKAGHVVDPAVDECRGL